MRVNTVSVNERFGNYLVFGAIAKVTCDLASEIPFTCIELGKDECRSDGLFH